MKKQMLMAMVFTVSAAAPVIAQTSDWQYIFAPYVWMADAQGDTVVKGIPADVDIDFWDDIVEDLNAGLQFHFEAKSDNHPVDYIVDLTWLDISSSQYQGAAKVKTGMEVVILDMKVAGDIAEVQGLQWTAGVRYMQNDLSLKVTPLALKVTDEQAWLDPVVGVRYVGHINDQWSYGVSADVGGFELLGGSELTWAMNAAVGWQFAENAEAALGYRVIDTDYSDGSGLKKYEYDARQKGPFAGVIFRF